MTKRTGYKLNPNKLKGAPQSILPYFVGAFYYTEDFEYFDVIKPYLDIPEPPKSLEEIQQELDEKIDKRIERVKEQFNKLGYTQEYQYQVKFNRIIENFEYAKEHGQFPSKLTYSNLIATGSNITSSFEIRCGTDNAGYYTIGAGIVKYYMNKKPNWLVRNCAKIFFDFTWKDV
jgi:hypothetical protein